MKCIRVSSYTLASIIQNPTLSLITHRNDADSLVLTITLTTNTPYITFPCDASNTLQTLHSKNRIVDTTPSSSQPPSTNPHPLHSPTNSLQFTLTTLPYTTLATSPTASTHSPSNDKTNSTLLKLASTLVNSHSPPLSKNSTLHATNGTNSHSTPTTCAMSCIQPTPLLHPRSRETDSESYPTHSNTTTQLQSILPPRDVGTTNHSHNAPSLAHTPISSSNQLSYRPNNHEPSHAQTDQHSLQRCSTSHCLTETSLSHSIHNPLFQLTKGERLFDTLKNLIE